MGGLRLPSDLRRRLVLAAGPPAELDLSSVMAARGPRRRGLWAALASVAALLAVAVVVAGLPREAGPDRQAVASLPAGVDVAFSGPTPDLTRAPMTATSAPGLIASAWLQYQMDGTPPEVPSGHMVAFLPMTAGCGEADIRHVEVVHTRPVTWALDLAVTPGCEYVHDDAPAPAIPTSGTRTLVVLTMPMPDIQGLPNPQVRPADVPSPTPWARATQD